MPRRLDPRSIEGSPERAADRGRDTLGFVVSERPSLGNPAVVHGLVRDLAAGVLLRFERHGAGELTRDETIRADLEQCARLAGIFAGEDLDYVGIGPWNGAGLAAHIRGRMPEHEPGASDRRIIELCFVDLVRKIYKRLTQVGDGQLDADGLQREMVEVCRSFSALLLGLDVLE